MSTPICFILNTASNKTKAEPIFKKRIEQIKSVFPDAVFIFVRQEDSISKIAAKAAKSNNYVIACGGDGTSNQVAKGLLGSAAIMGVLPLGSGNDFARNIGMKKDFDQNLEILRNGITRQIDVLEFDDHVCINTFGIGLDGLTNYYAAQSNIKNGTFRYFWNGFKAMIKSRPFRVDIQLDNDQEYHHNTWMLTLANGKTEGGKYEISPESNNSDGLVEVVVVKPVFRLKLIFEFIKLSFGRNFDPDVILKYRFKRSVSIQLSEAVKVHFDGEQVPEKQEYNIKLKHHSLVLVVPECNL